MKKILLGIAATLLGSSLIYANDTEIPNIFAEGQEMVAPEHSTGLTPKRPQTIAAQPQQPALPIPMSPFVSANNDAPRVAMAQPSVEMVAFAEPVVIPTSGGSESYLFAEMEQLRSAVQQLQKDTAKPDPKKSWSTPKLGGRLHMDSFSINEPDDINDYQNKAGLSELRLTVTGTGYEVFDYKAELVTTGDARINILDTWIGAKNVPGLGYFRIGHYNVETGLMYMGGSAQTTLTAFSPATLSFNLGRKFGCSSEHLFANDRIRWIYGFYQGQTINGNNGTRVVTADNQGQIFNTRLTAAPYYADKGRYVLHVGGHYSYINGPSNHHSLSTFLGGNNFITGSGNNNPLTTGDMYVNDGVNHHSRGGLELAYQSGPFRVLTEAFAADFGSVGTATGTVVECTYFLTGEHRAYNLATATFGAPNVKRPFRPFKCGDWNLVDGMGAWQAVARYNYTDLGDWRAASVVNPRVVGGYQHDLTFGMNWYWTSNLRCIFEYTRSQQYAGTNLAHAYQDIFGTSIRVVW